MGYHFIISGRTRCGGGAWPIVLHLPQETTMTSKLSIGLASEVATEANWYPK